MCLEHCDVLLKLGEKIEISIEMIYDCNFCPQLAQNLSVGLTAAPHSVQNRLRSAVALVSDSIVVGIADVLVDVKIELELVVDCSSLLPSL